MDTRQLQPLLDMPHPPEEAELQQFVSTANWMRMVIREFNRKVGPLCNLLEEILSDAGRRTKSAAAKVSLEGRWTNVHINAFEELKRALVESVTLAHPDDDKLVCLFTDASVNIIGEPFSPRSRTQMLMNHLTHRNINLWRFSQDRLRIQVHAGPLRRRNPMR